MSKETLKNLKETNERGKVKDLSICLDLYAKQMENK